MTACESPGDKKALKKFSDSSTTVRVTGVVMASDEGGGVMAFSSAGASHCVSPHPPLNESFPGNVTSAEKDYLCQVFR